MSKLLDQMKKKIDDGSFAVTDSEREQFDAVYQEQLKITNPLLADANRRVQMEEHNKRVAEEAKQRMLRSLGR